MDYDAIYRMAQAHHGARVEDDLPEPSTAAALAKLGDDRHLSNMAQCVFQAGFSWRVVEQKWPAFERAFSGFDPRELVIWPDERLEALASDKTIIRNFTKIRSVVENARLICRVGDEHGSYSRFIADWPGDDPVGLWGWLKANGSRLGGMSGPMYLRRIGKDTFILSQDVVRALEREHVIEGNPQTKANLARIQAAFLDLQQQSGRPLAALSRILARSVG